MYDSFSNVMGIYMTSTETRTGRGFSGTQALVNATSNTVENSTGVWYHVALTYNSTSVILYKNGVGTAPVATGAPGVTITGIRIGSQANNINPTYVGYACADCTIDDLRIYNTALTAAQVQSVYSSQGAPAPSRAMPLPRYAWDFQSSNVDYVNNLSPAFSTTAGALTAAPTYTAGKYGQAINFPNNVSGAVSNSYIRYNMSIPIASFSVAFWMNPAQLPTAAGGQTWVSIFDGSQNFFAFFNNANGAFPIMFGQNPASGPVNVQIANFGLTIPQNSWSHMAATFINGTAAYYFNGNLIGTTTFANTWTVSQLHVGAYFNTFNGFKGAVDDLRIFDRALTSAQVQSIYNQQGMPGRGAISNKSFSLPTVSGYTYIPLYSLPSSFTMVNTSTSNAWTYVGGFLTDGGANPVLNLVASSPSDIYSATNPGIWYSLNRLGSTTEYVRHQGFTMKLSAYTASNFDFAWAFFLKNGTTNQVIVYNAYAGGYWVQSNGSNIRIGTQVQADAFIYTISSTVNNPPTTLTSTPLFTQLSPSATSSAVGAFSLRAVNGTSARAVQVTQYTLLEVPPVALTQNTFTATGTFNGVTNGQYVARCSSYSSTSDAYRVFDKNNATRGLTGGTEYTVGTGNYIGTASTVDSTSTTYNGGWFQIQIPSAIHGISYSVSVHSSLVLTAPYTWKLFGSMTGSSGSWVVLDTKTSYVFAAATVNFPLSQLSAGYTYFRLAANRISPSSSAGDLGPAELIIYGYSSLVSSTQDFYADRLGNLLTAPVVGQSLANWLGGATGYVTTWYDQSGSGNHATQGTAANQPVIQRATKGPGYMINFNGTSQFVTLSASYNFLNGTNITVNAVALRTATVTLPNYIIGTNSPTASYQRFFLGFNSDTSFAMPVTGNPPAITIPAYNASNEPVTYMTGGLTPSRVLYLNNSLGGTNADTALLSVPSGYSYSIGYTVGAATYYYQGNLFELLIFKSALDQAQVTQIYQNQLGAYGT
jgi:hypothetical protein